MHLRHRTIECDSDSWSAKKNKQISTNSESDTATNLQFRRSEIQNFFKIMKKNFATKLFDACENLEDLSQSEARALLYRAALLLNNSSSQQEIAILIDSVAAFMDSYAEQEGVSRDEAVNEALIRWALSLNLVRVEDLEAAMLQEDRSQ